MRLCHGKTIMKKNVIIIILAIAILFGFIVLQSSSWSRNDDLNVKQIPKSLAQWYPPQKPGPEYLSKMWVLGGSMMGIVTNTLQGGKCIKIF